jgi:N utilization substance protein B
MANRHLSRSIILQTLFEWDFNGRDTKNIWNFLNYNIRNFAPGAEEKTFMETLLAGILKKVDRIDKIIKKAAPEWPIEQIAIIDRNVLRIGLYELLFGNRKEVPPKVAINESIELAKTFGGDSSGKFVNGVLGTVYKEIGEPGKDETSVAKDKKNNYQNIPQEVLGGAVVYRKENKGIRFALVHDVFGYWTLSKGKLEKDEDIEKGVIREIKEELGIDVVLEDELGFNEYIASDPQKGPIKKHVTYFLANTSDTDLRLESSGGLDNAGWFNAEELSELKIYDDIKPLIKKAIEILERR